MQLRLVAVPTPATARVNGNIGERIEARLENTLLPYRVLPIFTVAVPKVKNASADISYVSCHVGEEGIGPIAKVLDLTRIHCVTLEVMIEFSHRRG